MWLTLLAATGWAVAPAGPLPDFAAASALARPAVVKVQATLAPENRLPTGLSREDFYAIPEHHGYTGGGSGFIVSSDGIVLTNHHVVERAGAIRVQLADRRSFPATLIGSDVPSDIAVLKIAATGLPVVAFGDSETLKPGQWVLAIGSPFDMDFSVTAGIVSAKGRSLGPEQRFVPFVQTDVAINRGNSGGPLLDLNGRVVGMNSAIFSQSGGFVGLSFAIPAGTVRDVTEQIRATGSVRRGFLGVGYQDLTPALADALGLASLSGALVNQLQPGSPADRAGIRLGDVVLAVDGTPIGAAAELPALIGRHRPGTEVALRIQRSGAERQQVVELGELAPLPASPIATPAVPVERALELAEADAAERDLLGDVRAVIVREASNAALGLGLRRGDAIVALLGVNTLPAAADLKTQMQEVLDGKRAALILEVRRGNQRIYIGWGGTRSPATTRTAT